MLNKCCYSNNFVNLPSKIDWALSERWVSVSIDVQQSDLKSENSSVIFTRSFTLTAELIASSSSDSDIRSDSARVPVHSHMLSSNLMMNLKSCSWSRQSEIFSSYGSTKSKISWSKWVSKVVVFSTPLLATASSKSVLIFFFLSFCPSMSLFSAWPYILIISPNLSLK